MRSLTDDVVLSSASAAVVEQVLGSMAVLTSHAPANSVVAVTFGWIPRVVSLMRSHAANASVVVSFTVHCGTLFCVPEFCVVLHNGNPVMMCTTHDFPCLQEQGCCTLRHLVTDGGVPAVGELLRKDGTDVLIAALEAKAPTAQAIWAVEALSGNEKGVIALASSPSAIPALLSALAASVRDRSSALRVLATLSRLLACSDAVCTRFVTEGGLGDVLAAGKALEGNDVQIAVASVLSAASKSAAVKRSMVGKFGCGPSLSVIKAALKGKA